MDAGVFFQILFGFCGFICIRYCLVPLDSLKLPITMCMSTCTPSDGDQGWTWRRSQVAQNWLQDVQAINLGSYFIKGPRGH